MYSCVALAAGGRSVYAAGSDKKLRELEDGVGAGTQVAAEIECGCCITQLAVPASVPCLLDSHGCGLALPDCKQVGESASRLAADNSCPGV